MHNFTKVEGDCDPFAAISDQTRRNGRNSWLMLNMVSSLDGGTAIDGMSGPIGGPGDKEMFRAIRDLCDVIIVGSRTAKGEGYRPPRPDQARQDRRIASGAQDAPRIAVMSRSLDFDFETELFSDPTQRPIIITSKDSENSKKLLAAKYAELIELPQPRVDPAAALAALGAIGLRVQLLEGGPTLNGQFVQAGLLDELFMTLSPKMIGGASTRLVHQAEPTHLDMVLRSVLEQNGELYLRYLRK